jgi:hypothetical protein
MAVRNPSQNKIIYSPIITLIYSTPEMNNSKKQYGYNTNRKIIKLNNK